MILNYIHADVFKSKTQNPNALKVIPHVCNSSGGWGRGFVVALSEVWTEPEDYYREWHREGKTFNSFNSSSPTEIPFNMGFIQPIIINPNIIVVNMIAQDGYTSKARPRAVSYVHLTQCMLRLNKILTGLPNVEIHAPKFGAGLGGGKWEVIEELINEVWHKIPVYIYEWP